MGFKNGGRQVLTDVIDLLMRQKETWVRLRDLILKQVCGSLEELIMKTRGAEPENTMGYEDDHEELEAELGGREARRKEKRLTGFAPEGKASGGVSTANAEEGKESGGRSMVNGPGVAGVASGDSGKGRYVAREEESGAEGQIREEENAASGVAVGGDVTASESQRVVVGVVEEMLDADNVREDQGKDTT